MKALLPLALAVVAVSACATRDRTTELESIDQRQGYRYGVIETAQPKSHPDTFIVLTFSGGGTRAAALAAGALTALSETRLPSQPGPESTMANDVDLISSVSGGSVTAAYFALYGVEGLEKLKKGFLVQNVQGELILTALAPWTIARLATPSYARIDVFRDYLNAHVYDRRTYSDILESSRKGDRRPYVVLNAADMATGSVFSFTQDQFDLICSDLSQLHIADAVAASAAFPGALTALTLRNRAPCQAQSKATENEVSGWAVDGSHPRPTRMTNALADQVINPGRYRVGFTALHYLNEDGKTQFVHLLDGGTADNLGLTEPLSLVISPDRSPSILGRINRGEIKRLVFIVVNARSESETTYGTRATPPNLFDTLNTTVSTPIDSNSFGLLDRLDDILNGQAERPSEMPEVDTSTIPVDFDFIGRPDCRQAFKNIGTNWSLSESEIKALIELGAAMITQSKQYQLLVKELGAIPGKEHTVDGACAYLPMGS